MADGDPLILGQTNEATNQTILVGGPLAVESGFHASGPNTLGSGSGSQTTVNGHAHLNGPAVVGNSDTPGNALLVHGATRVEGEFRVKTAGVVVIEAGTSGRTFPSPIPAQGIVLALPQQAFNGYVEAARIENDQITIELSHPVPSPLFVSWFVVGVVV
jgi:hypothetical protein